MKSKPTYYDLSISQKILVYSQTFCLFKQVNNIFSLILLKKELDFDVLRKAIAIGYEHCDTMRLRLTRVNMKMKQYFMESDPPEVKVLDFTGKTQQEMDKELYRLAAIPIHLTNRSLNRIFLVRSWDGMQGIYLGVSHLALDSWAICVLLKYMMDVYESLISGKDMPAPLKPYEPLLIKELDYKNTPQYKKDYEFWQEECKRPEPYFTHLLGPAVLEKVREKLKNPDYRAGHTMAVDNRASHEIVMIPAEQINQMEAFCRQNKFPMQVLFIMAIRTILSARNDRQPDVSLYNAVARRSTQEEKHSGGTRVNALVIRTILAEECTFIDALQQVFERQSLIFRHAEIGLLDVFKMMKEVYTPKDILATYQSTTLTFQPFPMTFGDGTYIQSKWYGNGVASQPFYLTIMDGDGSGALRCYYEYWKKNFSPKDIREIHNQLMKVIMTGIENENVTIGELLNMF